MINRGPNGVWTLEERKARKKIKTEAKTDVKSRVIDPENGTKKEVSLADAQPTLCHLALKALISSGHIKFIISQNVDGLFLKTGIRREHLSEVHGNFYLDECNQCFTRFIRSTPSSTMGLKVSSQKCPRQKGKPCRGFLRDTILDWEDELPHTEMKSAEDEMLLSDLCICMGSTLQINPVGKLPFWKRNKLSRKVVIMNLSKTKHDNRADLVIHENVEIAAQLICKLLDVPIGTPENLTDIKTDQIQVWK